MAVSFSNVKSITIPEGNVKSLAINGQTVWEQPSGASPLCFTAQQAGSTVALNVTGTPTQGQAFEYSTNGSAWSSYTIGTVLTLTNVDDKVYFRGENTTICEGNSVYHKFSMTGKIAASGDVTSLLNEVGGAVELNTAYCFCRLFYGCTSLATVPALPSTTLSSSCYLYMFYGCTSITSAPTLPATEISDSCYADMFENCSSLTSAPTLPATIMKTGCYQCMFTGCTSLIVPPSLPATTMASSCYNQIFTRCSSLAYVPKLPATALKSSCYANMFWNCRALIVSDTQTSEASYAWTIPESGTASGNYDMIDMFANCRGTRSTSSPCFNGVQKTYYTQNEPV